MLLLITTKLHYNKPQHPQKPLKVYFLALTLATSLMKFSYIERMSPADWVVVTEALTLENNGAA